MGPGEVVYYQDKYDDLKKKTYTQLHNEKKNYVNRRELIPLMNFEPTGNLNFFDHGSIYSRSNSKSKSARSRSRYSQSKSYMSKNSKSDFGGKSNLKNSMMKTGMAMNL